EKPQRIEAGTVQLERTRIDSGMTLFMPALTGQAWLDRTTLPRSPGGFVQGTATCRVPGVARTYVAGDGGSFPGPEWMPKQAHQADLQAAVAARNLVRELRNQPADEAFRSELVCIIDTLERGCWWSGAARARWRCRPRGWRTGPRARSRSATCGGCADLIRPRLRGAMRDLLDTGVYRCNLRSMSVYRCKRCGSRKPNRK